MTTREELDLYFAIRALVELATLDAKTAVVKTLRAVREDVQGTARKPLAMSRIGTPNAWRGVMLNGSAGGVKSLAINNSEQKI